MSDLPFGDRTDFHNAERGRIDALGPCVIRAADGRVVWDLTSYAYPDGERPVIGGPQAVLYKARSYADASDLRFAGDPAVLGQLVALLDTPDPAFPVVTP